LIHRAVLEAVESAPPEQLSGDHLDLGSGSVDLLRLFAARYPLRSFARDYADQLMETSHQQVAVTPAPEQPRKGDRIFLIAVLGVLFLIVSTGLIVSFLVFRAISRPLSGQ
jgi:hypothetical protein